MTMTDVMVCAILAVTLVHLVVFTWWCFRTNEAILVSEPEEPVCPICPHETDIRCEECPWMETDTSSFIHIEDMKGGRS